MVFCFHPCTHKPENVDLQLAGDFDVPHVCRTRFVVLSFRVAQQFVETAFFLLNLYTNPCSRIAADATDFCLKGKEKVFYLRQRKPVTVEWRQATRAAKQAIYKLVPRAIFYLGPFKPNA